MTIGPAYDGTGALRLMPRPHPRHRVTTAAEGLRARRLHFSRIVNAAARRHGWSDEQRFAWRLGFETGRLDHLDAFCAGYLSGHDAGYVYRSKACPDDRDETRRASRVATIPTLEADAGYDGSLGSGVTSGSGDKTGGTEVGEGGKPVIFRPISPDLRDVQAGEELTIGFLAIHDSCVSAATVPSVACNIEGGADQTVSAYEWSASLRCWCYAFKIVPDPTLPAGDMEVQAEATPADDGESTALTGFEYFVNNNDTPAWRRYYTYVDQTSDIGVSGVSGEFEDGEQVTGGTSGATAYVVDGVSGDALRVEAITGTFQSGETLTGSASGATATTTSAAVARGSDSRGFVSATALGCIPEAEGGTLETSAASAGFSPTGGPLPFATNQMAARAIGDYRSLASVASTGQSGLDVIATRRSDGGVIQSGRGNRLMVAYPTSIAGANRVYTGSAFVVTRAPHLTRDQCVFTRSGVNTGFRTKAQGFRGVSFNLALGNNIIDGTGGSGFGPDENNTWPDAFWLDGCKIFGDGRTQSNTVYASTDFPGGVSYVDCEIADVLRAFNGPVTLARNCVIARVADACRANSFGGYNTVIHEVDGNGAGTHADVLQFFNNAPTNGGHIHIGVDATRGMGDTQQLFFNTTNNSLCQNTAICNYVSVGSKESNVSVLRTQVDIDNLLLWCCTWPTPGCSLTIGDHANAGIHTGEATDIDGLSIRDCFLEGFNVASTGTVSYEATNNHYRTGTTDPASDYGDADGTFGGTLDEFFVDATAPSAGLGDGDWTPLAGSDIADRKVHLLGFDAEGTRAAPSAAIAAIGALQIAAGSLSYVRVEGDDVTVCRITTPQEPDTIEVNDTIVIGGKAFTVDENGWQIAENGEGWTASAAGTVAEAFMYEETPTLSLVDEQITTGNGMWIRGVEDFAVVNTTPAPTPPTQGVPGTTVAFTCTNPANEGLGDVDWQDPENACEQDGQYATAALSSLAPQSRLLAVTFVPDEDVNDEDIFVAITGGARGRREGDGAARLTLYAYSPAHPDAIPFTQLFDKQMPTSDALMREPLTVVFTGAQARAGVVLYARSNLPDNETDSATAMIDSMTLTALLAGGRLIRLRSARDLRAELRPR